MENKLKKVVNADSFYQCPTKKSISSKIHEENRLSVLYGIIRELGSALKEGSVSTLYERIMRDYRSDWFAYDHTKLQTQKDDIRTFERFVSYLSDEEIVETQQSLCYESTLHKIYVNISFITRNASDKYTAYIVRFKKADKSPNGKSVHTRSDTDVSCMTAKLALEKLYPGISIKLIFLVNDDDSLGNIGDFKVLKTKKSNVFEHDYSLYYEDGVFEDEVLSNQLDTVLSTKVEPNCFNCDAKDICQQNSVKTMSKAKAKDELTPPKEYHLPTFTESQRRVIGTTEGAMLVCAGPGSGKTATIVGRIRNLISKGIAPEFILAITFTKEAANELKERCLSFCEQYDLPEIMTLNALGYQILRLNPEHVGNVTLMTQRDRYTLINSLLEVSPPLEGFSYSVIKGNNGLLAKVDKKLRDYSQGIEGDYKPDFVAFANAFDQAVTQHGYISYDEQITLAQKLFDEHPDVLDAISSRYKYIMVDEFQDIDNAQAKFIYSLSKKYMNICAVGDDDQSIYAFRGGTNKYMLGFKTLYPDASIFTLKENFRSTEEITQAASKQLVGNKRIKKEIVSVKKGGIAPVHVSGQTSGDLNSIVDSLVSKGINYCDIAVIASKNATLENLQREVSFPSVLGREYLVNNPFFKIVYWALNSHLSSDVARSSIYLEGLVGSDSLDAILSVKPTLLATYYCEEIAKALELSESAVLKTTLDLIARYHVSSCSDLYSLLQYMMDFGDETRIEADTSESVIFITSHESKGMEWRAVLLIDDFSKQNKSEEQNRLVYVAMTRAQDELYVFDSTSPSIVAA